MTLSYRFVRVIGMVLLMISGCNDDENLVIDRAAVSNYTNEIANHWITLELELIKETPGYSPPVAARAMAYSGIALYEALVNGMPDHVSLAGVLSEMPSMPEPDTGKEYIWPLSANGAMASILKMLFPTAPSSLISAIDSSENYFLHKYGNLKDPTLIQESMAFGVEIAKLIFEWSKTDGGHAGFTRNFPSSYVPPEGPGLWKPDFSLNALQPYWGENRSFVPGDLNLELVQSPTPFSIESESKFYEEAYEVYETVNNITNVQKTIANYWTDDPSITYTPPGHSLFILKDILKMENKDLSFAAEAYMRLGIAVSDAFVYCWKEKFSYNLLRPDHYIQENIDPLWSPYLVTPPFPEHTSGHSVQSGAASEVLTNLFGDNYFFTDKTHETLSLGLSARSFDSFYDFAEEAAISRLYGGIHFMPAIEIGLAQGKRIGMRVNQLPIRK